jgi:hypothetical protein
MLDRIHKIAEIVAAFAIVGSLVFVGIQMQQNTSALRNSAALENAASWQNIGLALSTNTELLEAWISFARIDPSPTTDEARMFNISSTMLKSVEFNYLQWLDGNLSDDLWFAVREGLVSQFEVQSFYEIMWSTGGQRTFTPQFQSLFDEVMAEAKANLAAQALES